MRTALFTIVLVASQVASAEVNTTPSDAPSLEVSAIRGSYQFVAPPATNPQATYLSYASESGEVVVYLNREGGLFLPGTNDSRKNTTSLVDEPRVLPPYSGSDERWDEVLGCVQDQFSGFHVTVTDIDPGNTRHYEAVISGEPGDLDQADHIGGISPFRLDCGIIDNSVVFVFAELFGDQTDRMCEVIAQEVAHSFGLDHQMNCDDPMSYMGGCGDKRFQNADAKCGEYEERECACGQETQNSRILLGAHLGDAKAPDLRIASPADSIRVNPYFYVDVRAEDNIKVERVELYADGIRVATRTTAPYVFEFNGHLEDGDHDIEVRVYDSENESREQITVTVDPAAELQPPPPSTPMGVGPLKDVRGGCAVSAPASGSGLAAMAALLALVACGRRRRRR